MLRLAAALLRASCIAICAAAATATGLVAAPPPVPPPPTNILPLSEVHAGQRGYGLSVFQGDKAVRFDVEVLGVLRNASPDLSYILARLSGQGLEKAGVIAGMSGSPVYIDDKLVGAVALGFPFSQVPIAGITPIEAMRRPAVSVETLAAEGDGGGAASPLAAGDALRALAAAKLPAERLAESLAILRPPAAAGGEVRVLWSAAGLGELPLGILQQALGGAAPTGVANGLQAGDLGPGSAVAGILVDGDLQLAVTGTVTDRRGDEVLAFGHPFLGIGPVRLPMAPAEILTVVPSVYSSFKLAAFGKPVGAFDSDRVAGVHGRLGLQAPMVPLEVRVRDRTFRMRVADVAPLLPPLVAISTLGALDAAHHAAGDQGLDVVARFDLGERGPLELRQSFDGARAGVEAAVYVLSALRFLVDNAFARLHLDRVAVSIEPAAAPRTAAIEAAHADRTLVEPGDAVTVSLDFQPYRGAPLRRTIAVEVPSDLPNGRYSLFVGDGATIDALRLQLEAADPQSLSQALDLLRSLHSRRQAVVLGVYGVRGLAVAGRALPRLPGSLRAVWSAAGSGSAVALRYAVAQQLAVDEDRPLDGGVRIDLEVRRRAPFNPEAKARPAATPATAPTPTARPAGRPASGGADKPPVKPAGGEGNE
ncbi:MAG: SpoIVB peptidase S55 domain-containing protein [Acidobacteriota bacterium]